MASLQAKRNVLQRRMLEQLSGAPSKPVPATCGGSGCDEDGFIDFSTIRALPNSVMAGYFAAIAARFQGRPVLILQDTTEFSPGKIGSTKTITAGRYKAGQTSSRTLCSVLMHSSLVVTTSGTPLGLSAVKFWTRSKFKGTAALAAREANARADRDPTPNPASTCAPPPPSVPAPRARAGIIEIGLGGCRTRLTAT
ncbi:hypothetical protein QA640_36830 [Bradyrhizobium sp. CB82]|uniref:hypothetical protein n=1 Tax=Bradyrhizobium sp. CB82 TaxID=3039159 RepID=UPI0024B05D88|nr:hypothetical protein [Bradyrhizobium sp. CB82]WFU39846.1 hypothetical protein QA640_36830 [Bradyrhizobium sp. CB82]